jgi:hypothetical protein
MASTLQRHPGRTTEPAHSAGAEYSVAPVPEPTGRPAAAGPLVQATIIARRRLELGRERIGPAATVSYRRIWS